jgi:hypothetical protein
MIRLFKRKQKLTTVKDLITQDDVNDLLQAISKTPDIKHAIVLYLRKDGSYSWEATKSMTNQQVIFMLESAKFDWLSDNIKSVEDDDDD